MASDTGRIRKNNQDSYIADGSVFAVADGMGGHVGGEVASKLAIDVFADAFSEIGNVPNIVEVVRKANSTILSRASREPKLAGMGTTLCLLSVSEDVGKSQLNLVNVGDSRGYLFRGGELYQLTDDHTLISEMLRSGEITRDQAGSHRARHILTRALGVDPEVEIDHWKIEPKERDLYLLCTDGLTNEMTDPEIGQVLAGGESPENMAQHLILGALANGGSDNVTCIVVEVANVTSVASGSQGSDKSRIVELPSQTKMRERLQNATRSVGTDATVRDQVVTISQIQKERDVGSREQTVLENAGRYSGGVRVNPLITSATSRSSEFSAIPAPLPKRATERKFRVGSILRSAVFLLILVVVIAIGVSAVGIYASHSYFVGVDKSKIAVYRGRPGGLLWYNPSIVEMTQLSTAQVAPYHLSDLQKGVSEPSLAAALGYVNRLTVESNQISSSTTTSPVTTIVGGTSSPTTTAAGGSG